MIQSICSGLYWTSMVKCNERIENMQARHATVQQGINSHKTLLLHMMDMLNKDRLG